MDEATSKRLGKEGWTRQFTVSEPRLSEAARLYRQLGFEVRLEPVEPAELPNSECSNCYLVRSERYRTIYTRLREHG